MNSAVTGDNAVRNRLTKKNAPTIPDKNASVFLRLWKCILLLIWLAVILIFIFYQDEISVDGILRFTPANPFLAAIAMLALFALKSLSIVIHSGILFSASGIMFPLPEAILLNLCGTAILVSIPYAIGKKLGAGVVGRITERYPKVIVLRKLRPENDFFFSFIVRLIGLLPSDIVSLYMGSVRILYIKYLMGCLLGFLPGMIAFTVIGMSITDTRSPYFIAAVCAEVVSIVCPAGFYHIYKKKHEPVTIDRV